MLEQRRAVSVSCCLASFYAISTLFKQNVGFTVESASGLLARNMPSLHSDKVAGASVPGTLSVYIGRIGFGYGESIPITADGSVE